MKIKVYDRPHYDTKSYWAEVEYEDCYGETITVYGDDRTTPKRAVKSLLRTLKSHSQKLEDAIKIVKKEAA